MDSPLLEAPAPAISRIQKVHEAAGSANAYRYGSFRRALAASIHEHAHNDQHNKTTSTNSCTNDDINGKRLWFWGWCDRQQW